MDLLNHFIIFFFGPIQPKQANKSEHINREYGWKCPEKEAKAQNIAPQL